MRRRSGLQALLLLQHARRDGRVDAAGELLTLEEQDRARWNRVRVAEGLECLADAIAQARTEPERRLLRRRLSKVWGGA